MSFLLWFRGIFYMIKDIIFGTVKDRIAKLSIKINFVILCYNKNIYVLVYQNF